MTGPRRFDVRELTDSDDPSGDADLGRALSAARALESSLDRPDARPSPDLADRIMADVAREPAPRPLGILAAVRRRPGPSGLAESLRVAWARIAASDRPLRLRAGALAYVMAVVVVAASLTGAAAYTTAGALGLFGAGPSHTPATTPVIETPEPLTSPTPTEHQSAEPTESPEPSGPEPSDERPGATPEPGDGEGGGGSAGTAEPVASGDHGGDGSSDGGSAATQTPEPGQSSRATPSTAPSSGD